MQMCSGNLISVGFFFLSFIVDRKLLFDFLSLIEFHLNGAGFDFIVLVFDFAPMVKMLNEETIA